MKSNRKYFKSMQTMAAQKLSVDTTSRRTTTAQRRVNNMPDEIVHKHITWGTPIIRGEEA